MTHDGILQRNHDETLVESEPEVVELARNAGRLSEWRR